MFPQSVFSIVAVCMAFLPTMAVNNHPLAGLDYMAIDGLDDMAVHWSSAQRPRAQLREAVEHHHEDAGDGLVLIPEGRDRQ